MRRTVVLLVVGLTSDLIGEDTPYLRNFAARGGRRSLHTVLPAVTCSVHATFTTGLLPRDHGAVATLRREKGHDISAACGQLRLQTKRAEADPAHFR